MIDIVIGYRIKLNFDYSKNVEIDIIVFLIYYIDINVSSNTNVILIISTIHKKFGSH